MTFIEAALKVLEHEGRPLHSREIAERAVEWGLLSHVGKTPVQTMSGCLSAAVAKGPGKTAFARVAPGVFGLESWDGKPPGRRAGEPPRVAAKKPQATAPVSPAPRASAVPGKAPAAAPAPAPGEEAPAEVVEGAAKKRKRKRRRKRPDDAEGGGRSQGTERDAAAPAPALPRPHPPTPSPSRRGGVDSEAEQPQGRGKPMEAGIDETLSRRPGSGNRDRKAGPPVPSVPSLPSVPSVPSVAPPAPAAKRAAASMADLADRAEEVLRAGTKPIPLAKLGEVLGAPGGAAAALLDALLTADGIEREQRGMRPRFVEHRSGWALAEREVSAEIITLERQATEASERLSRLAERQVLRRLRALPQDVLARVVVIFLRRFGFGEMRAVDRGRGEELHLSVQDRRRGGRFRTAVVVRRDPPDRPVTDADVASLRGALHHYEAMSALVITTGTVDERARIEAGVPNLAPVALVDGDTLARELVEHGIGVRERRVSLPAFDEAFFSTLAE